MSVQDEVIYDWNVEGSQQALPWEQWSIWMKPSGMESSVPV